MILDVIVGYSLLDSNQVGLRHLVRQVREDSDCDYYRDSSSDGSSDYEIDKGIKFTREQQDCLHLNSEVPIRLDGLSLNDEQSGRQEAFLVMMVKQRILKIGFSLSFLSRISLIAVSH